MMNLWILAAIIYLIAMLCIFAFVRGASRARDGELHQADDKPRPKTQRFQHCRIKA